MTSRVHSQMQPIAVTLYEENTITEIVRKRQNETNVLVYCMDVHQQLSQDDNIEITELTSKIGPAIWKNAIFSDMDNFRIRQIFYCHVL